MMFEKLIVWVNHLKCLEVVLLKYFWNSY